MEYQINPKEMWEKGHEYYDQVWPGFIHGIIHGDMDKMLQNHRYEMEFPRGFHCLTNSTPIETELQYNENFSHKVYLSHGINVKPGDCVVDAGANIGLFSIYLLMHFRHIQLYSFEPMPDTYEVMQYNLKEYENLQLKTFNTALGDHISDSEEIVFFPHMTGNTTFHLDCKENQRTFMKQAMETSEFDFMYDQQKMDVTMTTLSQLIDDENIHVIDLLKVDTEGSELEIFKGVKREHWKMIKQISMEVHGASRNLLPIMAFLEDLGYMVFAHEDTRDDMDTIIVTALIK